MCLLTTLHVLQTQGHSLFAVWVCPLPKSPGDQRQAGPGVGNLFKHVALREIHLKGLWVSFGIRAMSVCSRSIRKGGKKGKMPPPTQLDASRP